MAFDYTPPSVHIPVPKSEGFKVRGLCLDDITALVMLNVDDIAKAVELWGKHKAASFTNDSLTNMILLMSKNFPMLTSEILSIASDGWGSAQQMRLLPAGVQIAALGEVMRFTLEDMGGLKNFFGLFAETVKSALNAIDMRTALKSQSLDSATASAETLAS